jgi:hypothetical protein
MIVVVRKMSRFMRTYNFVVVLESMMVQYSAPGVFQTRLPYRKLGVIIASKYEVLIVLGQFRGILGEKW